MTTWQQTPDGFSRNGYEVIRANPLDWRLTAHGRTVSRHSTASAARFQADRRDIVHDGRLTILKLVGASLVLVVLLAVVSAMRFAPNPALPQAEELIDRLEATYQAIGSGVPIGEAAVGGVQGAIVEVPTTGQSIDVLTGMAGGECYVLMWGASTQKRARVLAPGSLCAPTAEVTSADRNYITRDTPAQSWHFTYVQGVFSWSSLLPASEVQRAWFIPAIVGLTALLMLTMVRVSTVALSGRLRHF